LGKKAWKLTLFEQKRVLNDLGFNKNIEVAWKMGWPAD
jgi:hypothetical protein